MHINEFNSWMFDPMCTNWESFGYFKNSSECEDFDDGLAIQGYFNLYMDYIYLAETIIAIGSKDTAYVFNSDMWIQIRIMVRYMFHAMNQLYMDYIQNLMVDITFSAQMIFLGITLGVILLSAFVFLLFWVPHVFRLRREIARANATLLLIPLEVYIKSRFLREAFEKKVTALTQTKH